MVTMSHKPLPPTPTHPDLQSVPEPDGRNFNEAPTSYQASNPESKPLDITQRIERKLALYNASQNAFKRWVFEIISWFISAVCMGIIIGILLDSKDKPLSQRPLAMSINNVLSKIASAALILPISEAIGQLKWAWFHGSRSRDMIDFEIFDKASRGAWGSFLLLFRTRGRSLAAMGAVLTLLLLATDTFFQQVSDLSERWIEQGHGDIPRIIQYEGDNQITFQDGYPLESDELNLRRVTLQYFYYNGSHPVTFGNGTRPDIPLSCPSSRCEWDPYETLGVCSSCSDVSELLTYGCYTTKLDWLSDLKGKDDVYPNGTACGYWLNSTSSEPVLMSGFKVETSPNSSTEGEALLMRMLPLNRPISLAERLSGLLYGGSIRYKDVYAPFLDTLIVSAVDGTAESVYSKRRPVASECILTWCVKTVHSSYSWGNYEEIVTDTFFNNTGREHPAPWDSTPLVIDGAESNWVTFKRNYSIYPASMDPATDGFGVSNETHTRTQVLFEDIFPSLITVSHRTARPKWRTRVSWWLANYIRFYEYCPWLAPNDINTYMERFATAMTDSLRTHKSAEYLPGRAYTQTTFVSVHWEWLTFPLTMLFLSLTFLVATIVKTSNGVDGSM
ncbi:uncharacterized protein EKO05_0005944 [Ascochyta rabiei]|uniref:uncharacterized protein n=1 Tax=Didymella rabiei TaxID=5454 RepID=UPI0021FE058B|nr:uncharacterized protein EKO05_0005944 [Ascochyta rabiei]UPX15498.1 hypothetical protein EKO05_0005944 [Ascochyta rabiei]